MKRELGYYWVKHGGNWKVAYCYETYFQIIGVSFAYFQEDFEEINETRIIPPTS